MHIQALPVRSIRLVEKTQSVARVRVLTACIRKHGIAVIPPIAVIPTVAGADVWDGHHRLLVARAAGVVSIPTVNRAAMRRADVAAYRRRVNAWRAKPAC
jgi:ParB-like chromosome segregation protein Spo0J